MKFSLKRIRVINKTSDIMANKMMAKKVNSINLLKEKTVPESNFHKDKQKNIRTKTQLTGSCVNFSDDERKRIHDSANAELSRCLNK